MTKDAHADVEAWLTSKENPLRDADDIGAATLADDLREHLKGLGHTNTEMEAADLDLPAMIEQCRVRLAGGVRGGFRGPKESYKKL